MIPNFGSFNFRDLHENNVLITRRIYSIEAKPEANKPVLIDFGRGAVTGALSQRLSSEIETELRRIIQDIDAYGALIWDLTKFWMGITHRSLVPTALIDIIRKCMARNGDERPNMRSVLRMLESLESAIMYNHFIPESRLSEAEKMIAAIARPTPSGSSYRGRDFKMSFEKIDEDDDKYWD